MNDASEINAAEGQLITALERWKDECGSVVTVTDCILRLIVARERFAAATTVRETASHE